MMKMLNGVLVKMTKKEIADLHPKVDPEAQRAALAASARQERQGLLAQSDWTQVADTPVDQAAWATYRQALRDVPDQPGFPLTINWPVPPKV